MPVSLYLLDKLDVVILQHVLNVFNFCIDLFSKEMYFNRNNTSLLLNSGTVTVVNSSFTCWAKMYHKVQVSRRVQVIDTSQISVGSYIEDNSRI